MKPYACQCGNTLYFANTLCLECKREVGYDSVKDRMVYVGSRSNYARCRNGLEHQACNWAIPVGKAGELCSACRLTQVIPNLGQEESLALWRLMEQAKRHVVYSLMRLRLPVADRVQDSENGLGFKFLRPAAGAPVTTGHEKGVISINLNEADDAFREANRARLHEPYRTLHGHFRHELGHYYWYLWFEVGPQKPGMIQAFREVFGDERADYAAAMKRHYETDTPAHWQNDFISAYSTMHPWEDWAESWAHYLHIRDGLETAEAFGLETGVRGKRIDTFPPEAARLPRPLHRVRTKDFLTLIHRWVRLSPALNALSESLGHRNLYPFVLSTPVVRKLHFIHACVESASQGNGGWRRWWKGLCGAMAV